MTLPRCVMLAMPLLLASLIAHAQSSAVDLTGTTADPNAPRFGLLFRGAMRAQLGARLTLSEDEDAEGFALWLSPLVELHEPSGSDQVLPSHYWRARVGLTSSYGWRSDEQRYRLMLALEHESDHETAHAYSTPGFLTQNTLALGFDGQGTLGALRWSVVPTLRLYLLSCTRARDQCSDFRGDSSVGAQLDLSLDAPTWELASLVPFVSVSGLVVADHARVRSERHVALHLGAWCASETLLFQAFALAYLGNDVGITRGQRVTQLGLGLSLSPR